MKKDAQQQETMRVATEYTRFLLRQECAMERMLERKLEQMAPKIEQLIEQHVEEHLEKLTKTK